jgi:hypothetical protein
MATGLGDAALNGRERVVVAKPTEHVVRLLIGKDAHRIEKMWQFLFLQRLLAAGPGDDGGDRCGGRRTLGYQGKGGRGTWPQIDLRHRLERHPRGRHGPALRP